jgi:KUP system potassium uptake protein
VQMPNVTTILLALGVVYADLGTNPLYTLQAIVHFMGNEVAPEAALGSLSLAFWSLIITISIKYGLFAMRAAGSRSGWGSAIDGGPLLSNRTRSSLHNSLPKH